MGEKETPWIYLLMMRSFRRVEERWDYRGRENTVSLRDEH